MRSANDAAVIRQTATGGTHISERGLVDEIGHIDVCTALKLTSKVAFVGAGEQAPAQVKYFPPLSGQRKRTILIEAS